MLYVSTYQQRRLDTKSTTHRLIVVINGGGRRGSIPAGLWLPSAQYVQFEADEPAAEQCWSSAHLVQWEPDEPTTKQCWSSAHLVQWEPDEPAAGRRSNQNDSTHGCLIKVVTYLKRLWTTFNLLKFNWMRFWIFNIT